MLVQWLQQVWQVLRTIPPLAWLATPSGLAMALWLGLATTTLAYVLFGRGLRHLPAGPIRTMKEALDEPEVKRRGMLKTYKHARVGDVPLIGSNYRFSDTPVDDTRPPPSLGEHTDRVLQEIAGLSAADRKSVV